MRTPNQALASQSPCLALLKKELGEKYSLSLVVLIIVDVVKFFNVGKSMNGEQVEDTARLIYNQFSHYKVEEFKLCFDKAKLGSYGDVFDRIDGQILFMWLNQYDKDRDIAVEDARKNENAKHKNNLADMHPKVLDALKKAVVSESKEVKKEMRYERKMGENDLLFQSWFKEFDKLRKEQSENKFVTINQNKYDVNSFIAMKLKQKIQ